MRKVVKRTGVVALALATMGLGIVGCDNQRASDKQVIKDIQESRSARLAGHNDQAQALLTRAANQANTSAVTRAHAKALLAQAQVELAIDQMNNPQAGVEAANAKISRLLFDISSLGQEIQTSNALEASYQQYNPEPNKRRAQQMIAAVTGDASKQIWIGEGKSAIPTLSAVHQEIAQLQGQVSDLQDQVKSVQAQQKQASRRADAAELAAQTAQGQAGVTAEKKAADLRKRVTDLSIKINVLNAKVAPLQADLSVAQARQAALQSAIDQLNQLAGSYDAGWSAIRDQAGAQKRQTAALYQGTDGTESKAGSDSITSKAIELAKATEQRDKAFDIARTNLTRAITNFRAAVAAAVQLQGKLRTQANDPSVQGTELAKTISAMQKAFDPNTFRLGQADAEQLLATLETSRVTVMAERRRVTQQLEKVLSNAGLSMPKELANPKLTAQITGTAKDAVAAYGEAERTYKAAAEMGRGNTQMAGHIGRMFALYGRSQLERALGNDQSARTYLADARSARDLVIQEHGVGAIPEYPSELVPAPNTQPGK